MECDERIAWILRNKNRDEIITRKMGKNKNDIKSASGTPKVVLIFTPLLIMMVCAAIIVIAGIKPSIDKKEKDKNEKILKKESNIKKELIHISLSNITNYKINRKYTRKKGCGERIKNICN